MFQSVPIADIDQPPPTGDTPDPLVQLRFGESGSTTVLEIARDNIGRELHAQTAELGQPLVMGADDAKVPSASFAGALRHCLQPGRLLLLGNALRHSGQIFGIDPAVAIFLADYYEVLPIIIEVEVMKGSIFRLAPKIDADLGYKLP